MLTRYVIAVCMVAALVKQVLFGVEVSANADAGVSSLGQKTKVVFFFDTEDFIQPRSCDAIRDMANVLASEGVKGHFALVGYLGKKLVDWRRFDVIDALKKHHIGTQTLYHSLHPNITEYTDIEDFDAAYLRATEDESKGIGMLMAATGAERMWCSVLPGNGNTMVALYLYADLGIPFFGGGTGIYEDVTKCGDIWYCNQRHLTYAYSLHLESFLPGRDAGDIDAKLDALSKQQVVTFYMHPHMAVCRQHWDYVFRKGNLHPFGEWPFAEARDPADTAIYYERIKAFLQKVKADPRFEITDCPALHAARNPRRPIMRSDVPAIRKSLLRSFGPVRVPGEWSIADCFLAAIGMLRGETVHSPGKNYGFLYAPEGVMEPVSVRVADLVEAAKRMDVSRFLPVSIDVAGAKIGPADFLFAALEAIETGADEVKVVPRDQIGDIAHYLPLLATVNFKDTWIYTPEYRDDWTSNRLRWQFWTFRYERPSNWAAN